jgi:hypothetical protein
MKRCSQCDFIYEDDQHLCDMDGQELVYEPTLQALQLYATEASTPLDRPALSRVKRLALLSTTSVLIATVLSVGYSGFTNDYVPQNAISPSANVIQAPQALPLEIPAAPVAIATSTVSPSPEANSPRLDKTKMTGNRATPLARSISPSTAPKREPLRAQPAKPTQEKNSGIRGFLKKTKKVLKRPFKF